MKIYTSSINKTNLIPDDVVKLFVVRSEGLIDLNKNNLILLKELSPTYGLLNLYLTLKKQLKWNMESFTSIYKPKFEKEMLKMENILLELQKNNKDIAFICYCSQHKLCHRSLLSKWFEDKGHEIIHL